MSSERSDLIDAPLMMAISSILHASTPAGRKICDYIYNEIPDVNSLMQNVFSSITQSDASRCLVYKDVNGSLKVHDTYTRRHAVNGLHIISITCFRMSGCGNMEMNGL